MSNHRTRLAPPPLRKFCLTRSQLQGEGVPDRACIEVDGPSHFVGTSRTPNGATLLKRRQLRAAGWALLPVPYWEWDALDMPGNADAQRLRQREYLTRKLPSA